MFISSWSGQCHTLQAWWRSREHLRIVISKLTSVIFTFYIFTFGYVACFDIILVLSLFYRFFIICHSSHLPRIHGFSGLRERGYEDL